MKRIAKKICLVILACACAAFALGTLFACVQRLSPEDAYAAVRTAVSESVSRQTYSWTETIKEEGRAEPKIDKRDEYTQVQVLFNKDSGGRAKENEKSVKILTKKDGALVYEAFCGMSTDEKGNGRQPYLFERLGDNNKYKQPIASDEFVAEHMTGRGYTLAEALDELVVLTAEDAPPAWAVFSSKASTHKGELVETSFDITQGEAFDAYMAEYLAQNQYVSMFANAERVTVEVTYGRVSNITCYRSQPIRGTSLSTEISIYVMNIVYSGPNLQNSIPSFDNGDYAAAAEPVIAKRVR